ncbi:Uncharacterised protein [Streptococcus pneumoniae]|nr:Uncharacterised protein [Streptococcus pneumoniae]
MEELLTNKQQIVGSKTQLRVEKIHLHGNIQQHILQVNGIITLQKKDGILINH